jgi:glycosyltransferase involved in cell wall biosynthesis
MRISVLICTRNRASALRQTLAAVFNQAPAQGCEYEVIVVDNGSSDATRLVIADFIASLPAKHQGRLRYCYEPRSGRAFARNTALSVAQGELLVFLGDDLLPETNWLNEIYTAFSADPDLFLLGGRVLAARNNPQPVAVVINQPAQTITAPEGMCWVMQENFAFRRQVPAKIGGFDTRLKAGSVFAGAEELDFVSRALRAGYKLWYAPHITVYHHYDRSSHKQQAGKPEYHFGKGAVAYFLKQIFRGDWYAVKVAYWTWRKSTKFQVGEAIRGA